MKAYKHLIKHALNNGMTISVFDGEVWEVKKSSKYQEIVNCIESVEEAQIRIYNADDYMGWALIIPSLDDEETVADMSCNEFLENWEKQYLTTV